MPEIHIRPATVSDAALIASQRRAMFADAVSPLPPTLDAMQAAFTPWVQERLADGTYCGWIGEADDRPIAGAGLWIMNFPPHFLDVQPARGYLLNFYVDPAFRGQRLARRLLDLSIAVA